MARMIPSGTGVSIAQDMHPGEAETLQHLVRGLGNEYTVFHSVHWARSSKRSTAFGEIDFVVVNQSGHVLVIEQKNGPLKETEAGLVKEYGFKDKNLHSQIGKSIDVLREKYSAQRRGQGLIVDYLLYCPDHLLKSISSPMLDASRVVDARAKRDLPKRIEEILGAGNKSDDLACADVTSFFA